MTDHKAIAETYARHIRQVDLAAEALMEDPDPRFKALGKALRGYRVTGNRELLAERLEAVAGELRKKDVGL